MITGIVNAALEATLPLQVYGPSGSTTQTTVIDTGYNGPLSLPPRHHHAPRPSPASFTRRDTWRRKRSSYALFTKQTLFGMGSGELFRFSARKATRLSAPPCSTATKWKPTLLWTDRCRLPQSPDDVIWPLHLPAPTLLSYGSFDTCIVWKNRPNGPCRGGARML